MKEKRKNNDRKKQRCGVRFLHRFKSLTLFSYKISLIKCLIDSSFKICNNWNSFHNDIENIKSNFIKNAYRPSLIDKVIKKHLDHKFFSNQNPLKDTSDVNTLNYHILATFRTILKINFRNFNLKLVFN